MLIPAGARGCRQFASTHAAATVDLVRFCASFAPPIARSHGILIGGTMKKTIQLLPLTLAVLAACNESNVGPWEPTAFPLQSRATWDLRSTIAFSSSRDFPTATFV